MIHYHGGPITPETCALRAWTGHHAFVSWRNPSQIELAASVTQSFALDNGAFSFWKSRDKGRPQGWTNSWPIVWPEYYDWCDLWLDHPACDWAIIPDVIGGTEAENDLLLRQWPHGFSGVPVWHLNESFDRFARLSDEWPRVALGSSDEYDVSRPSRCLARLSDALKVIDTSVKLHGLRMLRPEIITNVPLSSADSTNVARNIGMDQAWKGTYAPATKEARVDVLVNRIESHQTPAVMAPVALAQPALDFGGVA